MALVQDRGTVSATGTGQRYSECHWCRTEVQLVPLVQDRGTVSATGTGQRYSEHYWYRTEVQ